jgi:YidC/Oxa1 family membrane protein insertase
MDKKTIIAVGAVAAVGLAWTVVSSQPKGPQPKGAAGEAAGKGDGGAKTPIALGSKAADTKPAAGAPAPVKPGAPTAPSKPAPATPIAAPAPPKMAHRYEVKHELYSAKFNSQGGTLESFELKGFETPDRKQKMNLVGGTIADPAARPFALELVGEPNAQAMLYAVHDCALRLRPGTDLADELTCRYTDPNRVTLTKRVKFIPKSYLLEVSVELQNRTDVNLTTNVALQLTAFQGPVPSAGCFQPPADIMTPICHVEKSVERPAAEDIVKKHSGKQRFDGKIKWAGVDQRYFLTAAIARDGHDALDSKIVFESNTCELVVKSAGALGARILPRREMNLGKRSPGEDAGRAAVARFSVYMGPKEHKKLEGILVDRAGSPAAVELEASIDFWILGFLCKPMLWLLNLFYGFAGNFGIAIILLTLVVKVITFWPSQRSYRSMEGMKRLKKPMEEIRAKYAGDSTKMNQELMALYKTHKINPLGGCLPLLLQMPIWIALYRTIYSSVEIYQQPFVGWIDDLTAQDPYYVLPLLLGAVMFIQQRMAPSTGDSATMKMMQYGMPILFTGMMLFLPAGLVLYIFVNTILSILQQWLIKKGMEKKAA